MTRYLTEKELRDFMSYLKAKGLSYATIKGYTDYMKIIPNNILFDVKKFNKYIYLQNFSKHSIRLACFAYEHFLRKNGKNEDIDLVDRPKTKPNKNIKFLDIERINHLFQNCNNDRELLILKVLFETGIRVSVICSITPRDFDGKNNLLNIKPEYVGNKAHIAYQVFLTNETRDLLNVWIQEKKIKKDQRIFALSRTQIYRIVKKVARKAGLPEWMSPHKLRHSFATHFYKETKNIQALKVILGHTSQSMTSLYIHLTDEDKKKEFQKAFEKKEDK